MSTSKWGVGGGGGPTIEEMTLWFGEIKNTGYFCGEVYPTVTAGDYLLPDLTSRVRAGMDLLDRVMPGWQNLIDVDVLDLESDELCVLGQAWPHYARSRGLLERVDGTEYQRFVDAALAVDPDDENDGRRRNIPAAAFGFALNDADFALVNVQAQAEGDLFHVGTTKFVPMFWEHLTRTWIGEIRRAHAEGRWEKTPEEALT